MNNLARRVMRTASFMMALKGAVAGSITMLALFGVSVPVLSDMVGVSEIGGEGFAAGLGAILGVVVALRA